MFKVKRFLLRITLQCFNKIRLSAIGKSNVVYNIFNVNVVLMLTRDQSATFIYYLFIP